MRFTEKIISIPIESLNKRAMIDPEYITNLISLGEISEDVFKVNLSKLIELNKKKEELTFSKMGMSLLQSSISWAKSRFKITNNKILNTRKEICKSCKFWDSIALNGSGRCKKCGCSTWAKMRMATEKCPIGKW
jgi:hypothetical protein